MKVHVVTQAHLSGVAFIQANDSCKPALLELTDSAAEDPKVESRVRAIAASQTVARANKEWNRSQPPGTPPFAVKYDKPEFIRVRCELHPWMRGIFAIMKTSHYAVTDESGSFSLPALPPGKYTITAWHETYGEVSKEVVITAGEASNLSFVFKAKPY